MIFVEALFVFVIIALIWMLIMSVIFKKLNKARIKGVVLIMLAFIAVAAVIFIMGHFLEWHETNEFCGGGLCHAMEPVYESYTNPNNNSFMETHLENDVPCAQCHSGPGFIGLTTSFFPVPKEMLGEFSPHIISEDYDPNDLGGHVPAENCLKGCHEEAGVDWTFEGPEDSGMGFDEINGAWLTRTVYHPYTANGTSLSELKKLDTCLDCHDPRDNSFGLASEACSVCHDLEPDDKLEKHGKSTCFMATCHPGEEGQEPIRPKLTGHNTVEDHCMVCHNRDHPDDAFVPYIIRNSQGKTFEANSSFCADCHEGAYEELSTIDSKHFQENDCTECHLEHKTRPDCTSCHEQGSGIEPAHPITSPYDDCTGCHEQGGHNPRPVSFAGIPTIGVDFCSEVSCHGGTDSVVDQFENYGAQHSELGNDCASCHIDHGEDIGCTESDCHSTQPTTHTISYTEAQCLDCHNSPHDPANMAPRPGSILSQRDYMSAYFELDTEDMTNSFSWIKRGNHIQYGDCSRCHSNVEGAIYPDPYKDFMNAASTDCGGSCHTWIDTTSTGDPYDLLTSATEWLNHTEIFNSTTAGGCAGTCHQSDPGNPDYDGLGHGTVANCLNSGCHGSGFTGTIHTDHFNMVNDYSGLTGVSCGDVCHKSSAGDYEPIGDGCYDCHKSGHDPKIMDTSACYLGPGCHASNQP